MWQKNRHYALGMIFRKDTKSSENPTPPNENLREFFLLLYKIRKSERKGKEASAEKIAPKK